jgi:hypothetical protein
MSDHVMHPRYSTGEEIASSVSHALGIVLHDGDAGAVTCVASAA